MHPEQDLTEAGFEALRDNRYDDAIRHLRRATQDEPSNATAWKGIIQASRELGRWRDALTAYNGLINAATEAPDVVEAYMAKGRILDEQLDETNQARKHYERVLQFDATQESAYVALAELELRAGKWSSAVGYADHGLEMANQDDPARSWLLVVRAIGMRRISRSMGPVSTFFRGLQPGQTATEPSTMALQQAFALNPALRDKLTEAILEDEDAAHKIRELVPRRPIRSWWHP